MYQISGKNFATAIILILSSVLGGCFDMGGGDGSAATGAVVPPPAPPPPPPPVGNTAPVISGMPTTTAVVGSMWAFTPNSFDADRDPLTFSIRNKPFWADFDGGNGTLSGVPQLGQQGTYPDIEITVSDGKAATSLPSFSMTVQNTSSGPNRPPIISGTAAMTAMVGQAYSFRPSASDPDGDSLSYSVDAMPAWASFNPATGRLSGTPDVAHVGTYENIVISVTDGQLSASLPAFAIDVAAAATGSARLSWMPPTQNSDGSPLTDLKAYKFYYGLAEGDYPNVVRVDNAGLSAYVIDNLAPNTYFFVTTVVNTQEIESDYSNVASITVTAN